jgi:hypothetical protein
MHIPAETTFTEYERKACSLQTTQFQSSPFIRQRRNQRMKSFMCGKRALSQPQAAEWLLGGWYRFAARR